MSSSTKTLNIQVKIEMTKVFLQGGVIGVLGALLTLRIERHKAVTETRKNLLKTLNDASPTPMTLRDLAFVAPRVVSGPYTFA